MFKVDYKKVYDYVDWSCLEAVIVKMNLPMLWRKWITECVTTAMTCVLVNRSPTDKFPLERGLREGDPLSPFLFLMAAKSLYIMLNYEVENGLVSGYSVRNIKIANANVSISHL
jgi:hypothetical protein